MKKLFLGLGVLLILVIVVFGVFQIYTVDKAHSTFENYYAFRGCSQLISKTADSATCALSSGKTIKIVEYDDKWYLDGDLPCSGPLAQYLLCLI